MTGLRHHLLRIMGWCGLELIVVLVGELVLQLLCCRRAAVLW